ncbi:MAG: trypsin-like peptidase domain-containing protein [Hormoscilla sp.]
MKHRGIVLISAIGLLLLPGGNTSLWSKPVDKKIPHPLLVGGAHPTETAQLQELAESITVRVMRENGAGSGTLIRKNGQVYTVLTNAHVVRPGKPHRIETPDGMSYPAQVVNVTQNAYDMAILQFTAGADYEVVSLASSPGKVSEPVFAAGFPSEARSLLFTRGEISMFPPVALRDGYQIGYTNDIQQGMSGGPVLNGAGELIGINGMNAFVILQSAYEFVDGSYPSDELRSEMNRLSWGVPIGRLASVDPSFAEDFSPERPSLTGVAAEVLDIARQITVRIERERGNGSGVIIAQQGNTYYVLTAGHVMKKKREYEVVAHDGKRYPVDYELVRILEGVDMAVLQFQSNESYRVATLSNYRLGTEERRWVFLSGWPGLKAVQSRSADPKLTAGVVLSKERGSLNAKSTSSLTEKNGYELVYTNPAQGGMSGGPLLDARGRVIGIHAAAEGDFIYEERASVQLGFSLGVPVRTLLSLTRKAKIKSEWLKVESSAPPPLKRGEVTAIREALFTAKRPSKGAKATDWINYGNQLWRLFEYEEAVAAFDEAIKLKPKLEQAWYGRGLALSSQRNYREAVASFDKATEINPRLYEAWRERGEALSLLKRYPEALASFDKAINLKPEDSVLYGLRGWILRGLERYAEAVEAYSKAIYIWPHAIAYNDRGLTRSDLGEYSEAIADYNKAIEINPEFALPYNNRGNARSDLGEYSGAIADYNKAIEINPYLAEAYNNRGAARSNLGDYKGAISDYNKAIEINPQNGATYANSGLLYYKIGDRQRAIADMQKAAQLLCEQRSPNCQLAQELLRQLQQQ